MTAPKVLKVSHFRRQFRESEGHIYHCDIDYNVTVVLKGEVPLVTGFTLDLYSNTVKRKNKS